MALELTGKLQGHADSVLCCEVSANQLQLATGGEDGKLCIWDIRSHSLAGSAKPDILSDEAILSVAHHPKDESSIFISAGSCICSLDLRCLSGASSSSSSTITRESCSGGSDAVVACFQLGGDDEESEVNQVVLDAKGKFLAAADDNGSITVIDLSKKEVKRVLSGGHSNIVSSVAFRPHKPWEVCSGGLDSMLIQWDFSTGRQLQTFNMSAEAALHESGGQVFNPPHVNAISVPDTDKRPFCRMVAVARGDGAIVVYDADVRSGANLQQTKSQGGAGKKGKKKKGNEPAPDSSQEPEDNVPAGRIALLDAGLGGHNSSAAYVTFPRWSSGEQLLSGGNDSRVILWDWQRAPRTGSVDYRGKEEPSEAMLCSADVKHKVNWLATSDRSSDNTFVANITDTVEIYSIR